MSASDTGDSLRLVRSWLKIVAALRVNFLESVAAGAEFCFSGQKFRLSLLLIGTLYPKLQSLSNAWLSYLTQYVIPVCNRLWKWYATALCNPVKLPKTICNRFRQPLMETERLTLLYGTSYTVMRA
jgi:hypothetical protein